MNKERLKILADFLKTVPEQGFDLATWVSLGDTPNRCGTTGCAMGWACQIPVFKADGLRIIEYVDGMYVPEFDLSYGFSASARFFEIALDQALYLFQPHNYPAGQRKNPLAVVGRIYELIGHDGN